MLVLVLPLQQIHEGDESEGQKAERHKDADENMHYAEIYRRDWGDFQRENHPVDALRYWPA